MEPIPQGSDPGEPAEDGGRGQPRLRPKGRLQRITDWEAIAVHACYSSSALAQICGVSVRHLQRHIRATYDQNLGEWLNMLRINHGYQKLTRGETVKETAYSLGFKQVSHFSRLFKKQYGFTPSSVPITVELGSGKASSAPPLPSSGFPQKSKCPQE